VRAAATSITPETRKPLQLVAVEESTTIAAERNGYYQSGHMAARTPATATRSAIRHESGSGKSRCCLEFFR
jgi:hypothetical protein